MQLSWYGKQLLQAALFAYLTENSCLKTLDSKHKSSLFKTIDKFNYGTGKCDILYETKLGSERRYLANYADCKGKGAGYEHRAKSFKLKEM